MSRLLEYTSAITPATKVDRDAGVIRDVVILGKHSQNGRTYSDAAINSASLYEGKPSYVGHEPNIPVYGRPYEQLIGRIRNVRVAEGKLRGDYHVNLGHKLAQQLLYDAEHNPDVVGLSHDADGKVIDGPNGSKIVESIKLVRSVDLVTGPATTTSLFESITMADAATGTDTGNGNGNGTPADPIAALYASLTLDDLVAKRPDLLDALKKQVNAEINTSMGGLKEQLAAMQAKLDEYVTADAADQQMQEARINVAKVPEALRESIRKEKDPAKRTRLIESVKQLVPAEGTTSLSGFGGAAGWPGNTAAGSLEDRVKAWKG